MLDDDTHRGVASFTHILTCVLEKFTKFSDLLFLRTESKKKVYFCIGGSV